MIPVRHLILASALTFASLVAEAVPYQLGTPVVDGPACPVGSVNAVASPDGSAISILFDNFVLQANKGMHAPSELTTSCTFRIPIALPAGMRAIGATIQYRGFNSNSRGVSTIATSAANFVSVHIPMNINVSSDPNGFTVSQLIPHITQSACGAGSLDFTTALQMRGPGPRLTNFIAQDSLFAIDSVDAGGTGGIVLGIILSSCR